MGTFGGGRLNYIAEAVQRARSLGQGPEAVAAWRDLLAQTHVDEADYSDWARELSRMYLKLNRPLSAARVHEYLLNVEPALALYAEHGTPRDLGRVLRIGKRYKDASARYREAGMFGHAARTAEDGGDSQQAFALYEQLLRNKEATGEPYLAGLAALNAGRMAQKLGLTDRMHAFVSTSIRLLEEEGDRRELVGERDGAFRCYTAMVQLGRIEKSYEPLAEGYLNCIRLLKNKGDRFFTMQQYYDFIAVSDEMQEYHSVAELLREAGDYAKRVGFIYADHFLVEGGGAWLRVAKTSLEKSQPPEMVENALLAAVGCFNRLKDDGNVAACYAQLAELDLSDKKKSRYVELAADLKAIADKGAARDAPPVFPDYFRRRATAAEVWITDVLEAEAGNDIPDAIGRLVGDHKNVWEVQRRKSLLIALGFDDHTAAGGNAHAIPPALVERLGELGHAAAVRPLLAMFEKGDEATKVLVVERGSALKQKEAFALIDRGLATPGAVRQASVTALRRMTSLQHLDNLVRVFSSDDAAEVRDACLRSMATIGTDEACEFLLDVMRSNAGGLGLKARNLLEQNAQERMLSALDRNRRQEPDPAMRMFISRLVDRVRDQRSTGIV